MTDSEVPELLLSGSSGGRDRRQLEIVRLLRLMGGMVGDAYADACLILVQQPRLATASHLVAHLAREIDSAVRELLTAMLPDVKQEVLESLRHEDSRDPPRAAVVAEICDFLGIPVEDGVRAAWVKLVWHGRAHRGALREPRALDEEFLHVWRQFEYVMLEVGKRFEASYLAALPMIDELAAIASPTNADLSRLKNQVPQSIVAMRRFYDAAGPGWFPQLRKGGFFGDPPMLRPDDDGMIAYAPWPAGQYLVRVAAEPTLAADVVAVFAQLDTDNPGATEAVADVALVVSTPLAARLAAKIAAFLRPFAQWALPSKASEVVVRLAASGEQEAALTIVKALIPAPSRGAALHRFVPLSQIAPAYADLGIGIVVLLADLIRAADDDPDSRFTMAYSSTWRPAIERDGYRDGRDEILSALRDAAVAVAGVVGAAEVVEVLGGYHSAAFTRLSLYVLTLVPDPQLVSAMLTTGDLFADGEVSREYTALLRVGYPLLGPEDRSTITGLVEMGPSWPTSPEEADRWKLGQLARFGDQLPAELRRTYEDLVGVYGQPDEDEDLLEFSVWLGSHSPVVAAEIAAMTDHDLLTLLGTWQEPGGWRAPTIDGLRTQLEQAVATDPVRFARLSPYFIDLDPGYGAALLSTLTRVLSAEQVGLRENNVPEVTTSPSDLTEPFAWDEVLEFGHAMIDKSRLSTIQQPEVHALGRTWNACLRDLATLIAEAMQRRRIAYSRAEDVLTTIVELSQHPEPQPGDRTVIDRADPVAEAINTVRPLALAAAIRYLSWTSDGRADTAPGPSHEKVTALLDAHLDPAAEKTVAVRAVYGMYFSVLASRLGQWTRARKESIFGDRDDEELGAVAWQSFLRCNRASAGTFDLLGDQYRAAVIALARHPKADEGEASRAEQEATAHLLSHLAFLYGLGLIGLDSDIITMLFAEDVPLEHRARMLDICGQTLANTPEPPPGVVERLQALWDWRLEELNAGHTEAGELSAFGSWLSSDQLPASWVLPRLRTLLTAGGCPEPTHMAAKRLANLRHDAIADTVRCVALLIDAPTDPWFVDASRDDISSILADGLSADDPQTRQNAGETINRLVARGRTSFAQLLS